MRVVVVVVALVVFASVFIGFDDTIDTPIVDPPLQAKPRAVQWVAKRVQLELVFFVVEEVFLPDHELELGWEARECGK